MSAGCTRRLCDRRLWLVTKSALEVCIHNDALYKLTTFTFTCDCFVWFVRWWCPPGRPTRPTDREAAKAWFREVEAPKGVGLDPSTQQLADYFYGK